MHRTFVVLPVGLVQPVVGGALGSSRSRALRPVGVSSSHPGAFFCY